MYFDFCNVAKIYIMEIGIFELLLDKLIVPLGFVKDYQISH